MAYSNVPTLYKCSTVQCSTVHYTLYNRYNKYSAEQCSAVQPLCNCTSHLWQSMVLCGLWSGVCVHNYTAWSNIIDWTGYLPLPAKHCHSQRTVRKQLAVQYKTQQTADSRSVCLSKPSRPELELFSNLNLNLNLYSNTTHISVMELSHSYYRWSCISKLVVILVRS